MDKTSDILILDESGRVAEWLAAGDTVHVWQNADLSSSNVGGLAFTRCELTMNSNGNHDPYPCECKAPGWRYGNSHASVTKGDPRLRIFRPIGVASGIVMRPDAGLTIYAQLLTRVRFSDSQRGHDAALEACAKLKRAADEAGPRNAPIGRFWQAFTVKRLTYQSAEKRPDGGSLGFFSEYAVIEWSATDAPSLSEAQS